MSSPDTSEATPAPAGASVFQRWGRGGTGIVLGLGALVLLLIGATIGITLGSSNSDAAAVSSISRPDVDSVDVGFIRDMTVHHEQGVLLAHLAQVNDGAAEVAGIAYDIEYQQTSQIGQMGGFLQLWGYSLNNMATPMAWMTADAGHDMAGMTAMTMDAASIAAGALMPGMATDAEVNRLKTLRGAASDAYFLQLMIRHHEGGVPMMDYAAKYATNPVVQNMAQKMAQSQVAEIASMTQLLEGTYGGTPLPASGAALPDGSAGAGASPTATPTASGSDMTDMAPMSGMNMDPATTG